MLKDLGPTRFLAITMRSISFRQKPRGRMSGGGKRWQVLHAARTRTSTSSAASAVALESGVLGHRAIESAAASARARKTRACIRRIVPPFQLGVDQWGTLLN